MSSSVNHSIKLSLFTIFSRILGFVREYFQAFFFGTGAISYAWEIAFLFPGILRNLLVEGGIAQAFIPIYTSVISKGKNSQKEASRAAGAVLVFVFLMMLVVMVLAMLTIPYIFPMITRQSREESSFMIRLGWILLLFMPLASITAILSGIANSHRYFSIPALAPIVMNVGLIFGFLILDKTASPMLHAKTVAWFFVGTGMIQFFILYLYLVHLKISPRFTFPFSHPAVKSTIYIMLPAILSTAVFQINQLIDVIITSYHIPPDAGGLPALRFAQRLMQLPTGIIGVALSTAILPILSYTIQTGKHQESVNEIANSISFSLFLTVPASIGFFFLGEDIINVLFRGGLWDQRSTHLTWEALRFYLLGIPLYSMNKILVAIFFAHKDAKSPLFGMIASTVLNFVLNLIFIRSLGHGGIALSTAIASFVYFLQLVFFLQRKHLIFPFVHIVRFFYRAIPLWFLFTIFLMALNYIMRGVEYKESTSFLIRFLGIENFARWEGFPRIFVGAGGGFIIYMLIAWKMGMKELQFFLSFFKKRLSKRTST